MTRKNHQIGVRISAGDIALLKRICRGRGEDVSDFVRRAIRTEMAKLSFLTPLDRKALGVTERRTAERDPIRVLVNPVDENLRRTRK